MNCTTQAAGLDVRHWHGVAIQRRASDGYVNATRMCQANGKRWTLYTANARTRDYIDCAAAEVGIPTSEIAVVIRGGRPDLQGTWIHPLLAVDLARWISPAFAVWMDSWFLAALSQPQPDRMDVHPIFWSDAGWENATPLLRRAAFLFECVAAWEAEPPAGRRKMSRITWSAIEGLARSFRDTVQQSNAQSRCRQDLGQKPDSAPRILAAG